MSCTRVRIANTSRIMTTHPWAPDAQFKELLGTFFLAATTGFEEPVTMELAFDSPWIRAEISSSLSDIPVPSRTHLCHLLQQYQARNDQNTEAYSRCRLQPAHTTFCSRGMQVHKVMQEGPHHTGSCQLTDSEKWH